MQAIISSGGTAFDNFLPLLLKFMAPLSVQLSDLRSAIVKEAYNTLLQAAETCRDSFEQCAERISDTLFKLLNSGTKVLADAGHLCWMGILENVVTWRLVPKTVDNIRSKNAFVRSKSAGYLAFMLEHFPKQVFETGEAARGRVLDLIEQGIICASSDAHPEARAAGRNGFSSFRTMFTERADALFYRLEPAAQKAVTELIGSSPSRHAKTMPVPVPKRASRDSPLPSKPSEEPAKRPSSTRPSPVIGGAKARQSSAAATVEKEALSGRGSGYSEKEGNRTIGDLMPNRLPVSADAEVSRTPAFQEAPLSRKTSTSDKDTGRPSLAVEKEPAKSKPTVEKEAKVPQKPYFTAKNGGDAARALAVKYDSTGDTGSSASIKPLEQPRDPPTQASPPSLDEPEDASDLPQAPKMKSRSKEMGPSDKLDFIIEKTNHENWSTRCNSFTRLASILSSEPNLESLFGSSETRNALWDKLINTHIDHMADSHFKVVATCLSSLQKLIELMPEKVSYELEKIMPVLIVCLGDAKESVYQSSCVVLELIIDLYMADDLLKLILKSCSVELKPKMKLKLLEMLGILAETSEGSFNVAANIKNFLRKVTSLARDGLTIKPVMQAGAKAVKAVRDKNTEATVSVMLEMTAEEQGILKKLSNEVSKVLQEELKTETPEPQVKTKSGKEENPVYEYFGVVLEQCRSTGLRRVDGLTKLQKLIEEYLTHPGVWTSLGKDIVSALLLFLEEEAVSLKESALSLLVKVYTAQHDRLQAHLDILMLGVVKALYVEDRHSLQVTEDAVPALLSCEQSELTCDILIRYLGTEDSPALQALIRIFTRMLKKMERSTAIDMLRPAVTALSKALNHSNPDVRKSVVFSLVELNYCFGNDFQPYLSELTQSQQKLVTIYIQRRQEPYI